MKNTIRIIFIVIIFLGGAWGFRYWALDNFDSSLSIIDESLIIPNIIPQNNSSTIVDINTEDLSYSDTSTDIPLIIESDLSFEFPKKDDVVYEGCSYQINLNSSTKIINTNMSLVDLGTRQSSGPVASGLPKEILFENNNFKWKVGNVWPGQYYILLSSVNNQELSKKSPVFNIKKIPDNVTKSNIDEFCKNN